MSILLALGLAAAQPAGAIEAAPEWSIVIHGGAGTILREDMTPEKDAEIRAALGAALKAGEDVLAAGGSSLDAVTAAITRLEDDPNFNAGRGAVFTWEGTNSLDASIMRGDTLEAGAVAGLSTTRHPILAARKVMNEQSPDDVKISVNDLVIRAAAMALDWQEWWQEWPISVVAGTMSGFLVGTVAGFLIPVAAVP